MKKLATMAISVGLIGAMVAGGSLAYLTSEDSDVNVMTLGNVKITQNEHQRVDTTKAGVLTEADIEEFEQGKPLLPYVDVNMNQAMGDDYEEVTFPNGQTNKLFVGENAIDKLVSVTNSGKTDAYVRTIIALEAPTDKIDLSFNSNAWKMDKTASSYSIEVDGVTYDLFVVDYKEVLKPGETTPYSLMQFSIDWSATNEDIMAYGDNYDILVLSQAVQAAGFPDAATALKESFGAVTAEKATEWFKEMKVPVMVTTAAELVEALANNEKVILGNDIILDESLAVSNTADIDLNGKTLYSVGLNFETDVSIKNGTIESAAPTSMIPHLKVSSGTLTMNDVDVKIDDYLNVQASGNQSYGEYTGLEVANATAVLTDCNVTVSNETYRTWNYTYGITVNDGTVTLNGGSIVITSAGASSTDLETAISGMGNSIVTMNNVSVQAETVGTTMGHLVLNTTDKTVTDSDFVSYGGTYELNRIN